jgi:hypothetical protein
VITAKVVCNLKQEFTYGTERQATVGFCPDYQDGRNKDWAAATPSLELRMLLRGDVADRFEPGRAYTLTFEPEPVAAPIPAEDETGGEE